MRPFAGLALVALLAACGGAGEESPASQRARWAECTDSLRGPVVAGLTAQGREVQLVTPGTMRFRILGTAAPKPGEKPIFAPVAGPVLPLVWSCHTALVADFQRPGIPATQRAAERMRPGTEGTIAADAPGMLTIPARRWWGVDTQGLTPDQQIAILDDLAARPEVDPAGMIVFSAVMPKVVLVPLR